MKYSMRHLAMGAVCALLAFTAGPAASQEKFNWKIQTVDLPSQTGPAKVMPAWIKLINEMSGGRLKISMFTADQLVSAPEIVSALNRGVIDMAYTSPAYYNGQIPESNLNSAGIPPMLVDGFADAKEIWWAPGGLDDIMREAYLEHGVYFLGSIFTGEPVSHWTKAPVNSVEELKGLKTRSYGYLAKTFEKLGASPVFLPPSEVYTSLSQGLIDGSMTVATSYGDLKFYEAAPYFYNDALVTSSSMSIMVSKQSWDKLPKDLQAILKVANQWYSDEFEMINRRRYQAMRAKFGELGIKTISWSPQDIAKVREAAESFLPEIAAQGPRLEKGVGIIQEYLRTKE